MARPTKKTRQRADVILAAIRDGNTHRTAAMVAGISEDTLARWKQSSPEFAAQIERAEAEGIAYHVGKVRRAANNDWRASAWFLERKEPLAWNVAKRIADAVDMSTLTDEQVIRLLS